MSTTLYNSGTGTASASATISESEDEELERIRKFRCGCSKSCYLQLSHDFILKRRLDMKELTEGNISNYSIL